MKLEIPRIADMRALPGKKWRTYGGDVLPLWVADMDFPVADPIKRHLAEVVDSGILGYPVDANAEGLPEAFSEHCAAHYGWTPDPARVEVLNDVIQGIYVMLETFTAPGEGVVVQTPVYPPFLTSVAETGRRLVRNPLTRANGGFEMDLEALDAAIDAGTRMLMLCNPQNPTGRVFTHAELEALAERVLAHDLVVMSDEIHADIVYDGRRHVPFASLAPEIAARTVTLHSPTKAFNIAGLRCAVAHFGSAALHERFTSMPKRFRGGLDSFGAVASRIAWRECGPWLSELLAYLDGNRRHLAAFVAERMPSVGHLSPESTYLAWLDCRGLDLGGRSPFEYFLAEARVAGSEGANFGPDGAGWLRLNFATSREILGEALERIAGAIESR